jgi:NAD(P)-dependent dehydrogenase (short-subunit alcohol dehydrogenase family)
VNCAGVFPSSPALELPSREWDLVLDLNLRAPFLLSQAFARYTVGAGRAGNIINVASAAGAIARPGVAHYCASKAALIMLTKVLAIEWAEHDIRVNAVAPGLIETPGVEELLVTEEGRREHEQKIAKIPQARTGRPREVAETVIFLASDAASFVTGHTLFVDGGYSAGHTFRG